MRDKAALSVKLFYSLFFYSFFIEALLLFIVIFVFILLQYLIKDNFTVSALRDILTSSLLYSTIYILIVKLLRWVLNFINRIYSGIIPFDPERPIRLSDSLTNVFTGLAFYLATGPVRPILKSSGAITLFNRLTINWDALTVFIILGILALPVIIINLNTNRSNFSKTAHALFLTALIWTAGFINNTPFREVSFYDSATTNFGKKLITQGLDLNEAFKGINGAKSLAYYWMGSAEIRLGNRQQGNIYLTRSTELNPTYGPPYGLISLTYSFYGEGDTAKIFAQKCIDHSPYFSKCYFAMAKSMDTLGYKEDAFRYYKIALEFDPEDTTYKNEFDEFILTNPQLQ